MMKLPLFQNAEDKKSISFTMLAVGFGVITLWLFLSIFSTIAGIEIRPFNSAEAMAYFSPLGLLYWGRKWSSDKAVVDAAEIASHEDDEETSVEISETNTNTETKKSTKTKK